MGSATRARYAVIIARHLRPAWIRVQLSPADILLDLSVVGKTDKGSEFHCMTLEIVMKASTKESDKQYAT